MQKILFVADGAEKARETLGTEQLRNVWEDFARGFTDLEKS
jgi:HD superfamily phosphohydrolase YqeK